MVLLFDSVTCGGVVFGVGGVGGVVGGGGGGGRGVGDMMRTGIMTSASAEACYVFI